MAKRIVSGVNNINEFPDDILSHILSLLSTKEAARTSILSRRWEDIFMLLSNLAIGVFACDEEKEWSNFVDRLVFNRDLATIQRLCLDCYLSIDSHRVSTWICALVLQKIQELDFSADCPLFNDSSLPQSLFCCESLVVLKLNLHRESNEIKVLDRICLPCLKVLCLTLIKFPNDGSEQRLFSSCPALEELVLIRCFSSKGCIKFSISNQNLKRLTIRGINLRGETPVDILISAPSLVHLSYDISKDYSLVMDAKSLAVVAISMKSGYYHDNRYIVDALGWIRTIKTLEVDYDMLWDLKEYNFPLPLFDKMTRLKFRSRRFWLEHGIEYFLARCVVLETLVFEEYTFESTRCQYSLKKSVLAPLLCHLRKVEFKIPDMVQAEAFMKVMAFFLENAMVLEELKIRCVQSCNLAQQVEIMRKLASFPRASNKCRLLV